MKLQQTFVWVLLTASVSACTLIPNKKLPDYSAPAAWQMGAEASDTAVAIDQITWQEYFNNAALKQVIELALQNNRDLKQAMLNVEATRNMYRIERANILPSIDANGTATYAGTSKDESSTGARTNSELYSANLGVTAYEFDLFGKVRSLSKAALNTYFASRAAQDAARNALIAETANAYMVLLTDQKLLQVTTETLNLQQQTFDLINRSYEVGITNTQDLARAKTNLAIAQTNLHKYQLLVQQDTNALVALLGVSSADFIPEGNIDDITPSIELLADMPSQILLNRPDVQQAEYELYAQNANIGAARAAFFPSITLTGSYGVASPDIGTLFQGSSIGSWNFIPQITLPIFQSGRNKANLNLAHVRKKQAVLTYEQTIQNAFKEVADELAAKQELSAQWQSQTQLVEAAQQVSDIADARYKAGIDRLSAALEAQRDLYTYQQGLVQLQYQVFQNYINLYKVMGGK